MMNAVGKWLENNKTPGRKVSLNTFWLSCGFSKWLHSHRLCPPGEADRQQGLQLLRGPLLGWGARCQGSILGAPCSGFSILLFFNWEKVETVKVSLISSSSNRLFNFSGLIRRKVNYRVHNLQKEVKRKPDKVNWLIRIPFFQILV